MDIHFDISQQTKCCGSESVDIEFKKKYEIQPKKHLISKRRGPEYIVAIYHRSQRILNKSIINEIYILLKIDYNNHYI